MGNKQMIKNKHLKKILSILLYILIQCSAFSVESKSYKMGSESIKLPVIDGYEYSYKEDKDNKFITYEKDDRTNKKMTIIQYQLMNFDNGNYRASDKDFLNLKNKFKNETETLLTPIKYLLSGHDYTLYKKENFIDSNNSCAVLIVYKLKTYKSNIPIVLLVKNINGKILVVRILKFKANNLSDGKKLKKASYMINNLVDGLN